MTWPFENDTSAVEKKLASRSIKADKRRSVFVILTITLAVCLMGTLCIHRSFRNPNREDTAVVLRLQDARDGIGLLAVPQVQDHRLTDLP